MDDIITTAIGQSDSVSTLAENHLADLRKSGLSDQQIATCGFRTLTDPDEVAHILHRSQADRLGPCLLIPYFDQSGQMIPVTDFARVKPDTPRTTEASEGRPGTPIKYESPIGSRVRLYFPPGTCPKLADPTVPLLVIEGEKKAAKTDQEGFACVGLGGVEAWSRKREVGPDGKKIGKRELIEDFNAINLSGRLVYIVFDSDISDKINVQWAAWNLSQALTARGAIAKVVRLPNGPPDADGHPTKVGLDDYLVAHSAAALRDLLQKAEPPTKPERQDDRTEIWLSPNEAEVNDSVLQALARDDQLYQRGGRLVHVARGVSRDGIDRPKDNPRVLSVPLAGLRERLTRICRFVVAVDNDKSKRTHPPKWCYEAIAARGQWSEIRLLAGIVTSPVLRPDGSVLCVSGYDSQTALLFDSQGVTYPILERPSRADAIRAAESLLELVADFPFASPEHRAAWLAYLLTAMARFAFIGPAPLFLIDANVRGSGKSLLADVVAIMITGRDMPRMANPKDDDESRKRITALALAGDTLVLIDNIEGGFGCAALDAALTSTTWKDRILGRSEVVELPLDVTWCATGNNVILQADTSRRVVHIRLDSPLENPEQREGFRHANLRAYVRENRPTLLGYALTILAAYCQAGRPQQHLPVWGSFEAWSDLVRQCIVWCGLPDSGITRAELTERSDCEASAYRDLVAGWAELDPTAGGLTATEILGRLASEPNRYHQLRDAIAELCPSRLGQSPSPKSLGSKLRHYRRRVVGGHYLDSRQNRRNMAEWFVATVGQSVCDSTRTEGSPEICQPQAGAAGSAGFAGSVAARRPRDVVVGGGHVAGSAGSAGSISVDPSRDGPRRVGAETVIAGFAGSAGFVSAPFAHETVAQRADNIHITGDPTGTDPANPADPACDEVEVF